MINISRQGNREIILQYVSFLSFLSSFLIYMRRIELGISRDRPWRSFLESASSKRSFIFLFIFLTIETDENRKSFKNITSRWIFRSLHSVS